MTNTPIFKVWLDDLRPAPFGWKWYTSSGKTIGHMMSILGMQDRCRLILSLDHDLGSVSECGQDVTKKIEELAFTNPDKLMNLHTVYIHSANPVGIEKMCADMRAANNCLFDLGKPLIEVRHVDAFRFFIEEMEEHERRKKDG